MINGPFPETNEWVAGFGLWKCESLEKTIAWVKKCPNPMRTESEIELRQIDAPEHFGDALPAEVRVQELRLRQLVQWRAG